jgi:hypothetical protein
MEETLKQPESRPNEEWADFLLNMLVPECTKRGWVVEYESVEDRSCTIVAHPASAEGTSLGEGIQQLRLIPDEPEVNQYYRE